MNCVVNLSDEELDKSTMDILQKGLNFTLTPHRIPHEEIICAIEDTVKGLLDDEAEDIRQECAIVLKNARPPRSNITKDEYNAVKKLKDRKDVMVLKANKGNATIFLRTEDYLKKMTEHLESGCYKKVTKDPLKKVMRDVTKVIKNSSLDEETKKKLTPKNVIMPIIYGLPKIHKSGIPLRPIVNTIGSPTYDMAKHLAKTLKPLDGKSFSFIKDSS